MATPPNLYRQFVMIIKEKTFNADPNKLHLRYCMNTFWFCSNDERTSFQEQHFEKKNTPRFLICDLFFFLFSLYLWLNFSILDWKELAVISCFFLLKKRFNQSLKDSNVVIDSSYANNFYRATFALQDNAIKNIYKKRTNSKLF